MISTKNKLEETDVGRMHESENERVFAGVTIYKYDLACKEWRMDHFVGFQTNAYLDSEILSSFQVQQLQSS